MAEYRYRVAGLNVLSDLPMPGLIDSTEASAPDVIVTRGHVPETPNEITDPTAELIIDIPGVMRMAMRGGHSLTYAPAPTADDGDLALFLGGTGFGALMQQRGEVVLHASAVRVGDGAVLFCGESGAGKSTIAAALNKIGHAMVADDFCVLRFDQQGTARVYPDGRRHKLWQTALQGLEIEERRGEAVQGRMEKFFVEPQAVQAEPLPVMAIYELAVAGEPSAIAGSAFDMVRIVRANAYRPALVGLMRQQQLLFQAATNLAVKTKCFRLERPMRFEQIDRCLKLVTARWQTGEG